MNTHAERSQENKKQLAAGNLSEQQPTAATTLEDNRSETVAQTKLQKGINNSPRVKQLMSIQSMMNSGYHTAIVGGKATIQKEENTAVSARTIQLARWDRVKEPLKTASAGTASLATFGMAIINRFRDVAGINARIGGSLAAKLFGGKREPVDIDIEIPGNMEAAKAAKDVFQNWIARRALVWITGPNYFKITGFGSSAGLITIDYKSAFFEGEADLDDDDDAGYISLMERFAQSETFNTKIDFSSESVFANDLAPTPSTDEGPGFYSPQYLIASYLNRRISEPEADPKDDRGQISAMLAQLVKDKEKENGKQMNAEEIKTFLGVTKGQILSHVKQTSPKLEGIGPLFDSISKELIPAPAKQSAGKEKVYLRIPPEGSDAPQLNLNITDDTYRAIKELAEDRGLEDEADALVAAFKKVKTYRSREQLESTLLAVVPKRQSAISSIADYIIEEYGN